MRKNSKPIDKLIIGVRPMTALNAMAERLRGTGISLVRSRAPTAKHYVIEKPHQDCPWRGIIHVCEAGGEVVVNSIDVNPGQFGSLRQWLSEVRILLTPQQFACSTIRRMDSSILIEHDFAEVLAGIHVARKRARKHMDSMSCERAGLVIGAGNDKISLYDHARKNRQSEPSTRIERQLRGRSVPVRMLSALEWSENLGLAFARLAPFDIVRVFGVRIGVGPPAKFTAADRECFARLDEALCHVDLATALHAFERNRAMRRTLRKHVLLVEPRGSLSEMFNTSITKFLEDPMRPLLHNGVRYVRLLVAAERNGCTKQTILNWIEQRPQLKELLYREPINHTVYIREDAVHNLRQRCAETPIAKPDVRPDSETVASPKKSPSLVGALGRRSWTFSARNSLTARKISWVELSKKPLALLSKESRNEYACLCLSGWRSLSCASQETEQHVAQLE